MHVKSTHQHFTIIEEFSYITDKWIYLGVYING